MKNIAIKALAALALIVSSISCTTSDAEKDASYRSSFINSNEVSAWSKSKVVKSFDPETDQIVYSEDKSTFIISNMDYSTHYTLSLSGNFIVDYTVTVTCETEGINSLSSNTYEMTVLQAQDSDKTYWLWDSTTSTGFIVCFSI